MKRYREQEKEGPWKKFKATNPSLEPITLIEGYLNEIEDKVCDTTVEVLHQFEQQHQQSLSTIQKDLSDL